MPVADRHIEILAGTPRGGGQDRAARALADALDVRTIVTNIPGRGGGNAWDELATRAGRADVVSISSPTVITNRELSISQIDDRDLTVLAHLCTEYLAFVVRADDPIDAPTSLREAVAGAGFGVAIATERGNVNHIALARVAVSAEVDPASLSVQVFDSARYAIADLVGGGTRMAVVSAASTIPELESSAVRVVAVSAHEPMPPPFDHVPTWVEAGVDCAIGTWRGLVAPPALTDDDIQAWDMKIEEVVATESWAGSVMRHRWVSDPLDHRGAQAFLAEQRRVLRQGLHDLGLSKRD